MIDPELQQRFREYLLRCDEAHLEYEEKHGDAGDAYAHCVTESPGVADALAEYIRVNFPDWSLEEAGRVIDEFDQWSFDMTPGHRFSGWSATDPDENHRGCCVWGTSIEEVENQYEVKALAEELDCEVEDIRELVGVEYEKGEFCIGSLACLNFDHFYTYQCTDACWFAVVPYDWFIEKITEIRGSV